MVTVQLRQSSVRTFGDMGLSRGKMSVSTIIMWRVQLKETVGKTSTSTVKIASSRNANGGNLNKMYWLSTFTSEYFVNDRKIFEYNFSRDDFGFITFCFQWCALWNLTLSGRSWEANSDWRSYSYKHAGNIELEVKAKKYNRLFAKHKELLASTDMLTEKEKLVCCVVILWICPDHVWSRDYASAWSQPVRREKQYQ